MTITQNSKLPPASVLYASRDGVRREMERKRKYSESQLKKLCMIYVQLDFIIKSL